MHRPVRASSRRDAPAGVIEKNEAWNGRGGMLTPAELVWLLAAVAKGDAAAFERLYAATRAKLYGVVLRILKRRDLAEEIMQETYLKIWNSAGRFDPALSSP